jgi:hypothetical protein
VFQKFNIDQNKIGSGSFCSVFSATLNKKFAEKQQQFSKTDSEQNVQENKGLSLAEIQARNREELRKQIFNQKPPSK